MERRKLELALQRAAESAEQEREKLRITRARKELEIAELRHELDDLREKFAESGQETP